MTAAALFLLLHGEDVGPSDTLVVAIALSLAGECTLRAVAEVLVGVAVGIDRDIDADHVAREIRRRGCMPYPH